MLTSLPRHSMLPATHTAWVISDAAAGNRRQAMALASALGVEFQVVTVNLRAPWAWLAPRVLPCAALAFGSQSRALPAAPWPQLAIGCGRAAALLTRLLRERSGGECFTVQVLDPRIDPRHWDAVVAPAHDRLQGPNVLTTLGSLNPIDDGWLAAGRAALPDCAALPQPRVAVLVGGPRRGIRFDAALAHKLVDGVRKTAYGGSVLATVSRRTPPEFAGVIRAALADLPGLFWNGDGANPYAGLLGWADAIVATPDSVNMLSEACAVGVPVHTVVAAPLPARLASFHAALRERGLLTNPGTPRGDVPPLRETLAVATRLRERMAARMR